MKSVSALWVVGLVLAAAAAPGQTPATSPAPSTTGADGAAPATTTAPPAWKPFQEFGFLMGAWSGTTDSAGRVGGTVTRWTSEMGGSFLAHRVSTVFSAQGGKPEESIELLGYYSYDRDRRRYVATYFFSSGIHGIFDVDFPTEGSLRLTSLQLVNTETGARSRMELTKKSDTEETLELDLAAAGKEFVPYLTAKLTKR